jgi:hypothetical protein
MEKVENNNNLAEEKNEEDDEIVSVGLKATFFNNIIDRYYTKIYLNKDTDKEQYIFIHSNGIILTGIGINHFLVSKFREGLVSKLTNLNKLAPVKGKKKHGARILNENEYVMEVEYYNSSNKENENVQVFKFSPGVKQAKLMDINENIFNNNSLLMESPEKFGFICMLFLDHNQVENLKKKYFEVKEV